MKKKLNIIFICALFVLAACSSSSEKLYNVSSTGAISYVRGKTLQGNITIPKNVNGQEVKTIAVSGFEDCYEITSITIPDGITAIGAMAFDDCTSLQSITIPNSVNEIGKEAFKGCKALASITIPNSVDTIHSATFEECEALTKVELGNSLTTIEANAFESCSALSSITIPATIKSIGESAFEYCSSLYNITYESTKDDWESISKGSRWCYQVSPEKELTVTCTDGSITINKGTY